MTVSTTPLRWPDPLAPVLQQAAAAANRCTPWWESIHFADSSELRTQHRHATSADRAFTAAAHPLLEALVRACWATTTATPPEHLVAATRLLGQATPGPWTPTDTDDGAQTLVGVSGEIARITTDSMDPYLLAEALPGERGEIGCGARYGDLDLLAAAPRAIVALTSHLSFALRDHQPRLEFLDVYDLTDPDDRAAAEEAVSDIDEYAEEVECRCGQPWPCPPRQLLTHHLTGERP